MGSNRRGCFASPQAWRSTCDSWSGLDESVAIDPLQCRKRAFAELHQPDQHRGALRGRWRCRQLLQAASDRRCQPLLPLTEVAGEELHASQQIGARRAPLPDLGLQRRKQVGVELTSGIGPDGAGIREQVHGPVSDVS